MPDSPEIDAADIERDARAEAVGSSGGSEIRRGRPKLRHLRAKACTESVPIGLLDIIEDILIVRVAFEILDSDVYFRKDSEVIEPLLSGVDLERRESITRADIQSLLNQPLFSDPESTD